MQFENKRFCFSAIEFSEYRSIHTLSSMLFFLCARLPQENTMRRTAEAGNCFFSSEQIFKLKIYLSQMARIFAIESDGGFLQLFWIVCEK